MPRLVIRSGPLGHQEFPLNEGINHVGRAEGNDLCLNDSTVSGAHCHIVIGENGATIIDLNSTNGTCVNQLPVQTARLKPGDTVQLGTLECVFVADAPARAAVRVAAPKAAPESDAPPSPPPVRVRLSPPAELPPEPPRIAARNTAPVGPAGPGVCKSHPKLPARQYCPTCQRHFCELCVVTHQADGEMASFCRACGTRCVPAAAPLTPGTGKPTGFFSRLPGAFVYPLRGNGALILIVATIVFAALNFLSRGLFALLIQVIVYGYLFSFMQNILHATALEEDHLPELPSMTDFWEDIVLPFFRLLGVTLVAFGPALALLGYAIFNEQPAAGVAMIPALILGCLYFPMAFLAVALFFVNPCQVGLPILREMNNRRMVSRLDIRHPAIFA